MQPVQVSGMGQAAKGWWKDAAKTPRGKQTKKGQQNQSWGQGGGRDGGKKFTEWFVGYCDWCNIYGHKKLDCWTFQKTAEYKQLKEKLQNTEDEFHIMKRIENKA